MNLPTLDYMIGVARERATVTGREYAIVRMDSANGESRRLYVMPLDDTDSPEFLEFDGRIVGVVSPD